MKILALDTSGGNCSACLLEDDKIVSEFSLSAGVTHSQTLLPIVDTLNQFSNIDISEVDVFACSTGPGSFTGLRIGIATVKGFALSLEKKVIGVPTLLGLAYNIPYFDGLICSVLDAKNNNVYAGIYRYQEGVPVLVGDYITESSDKLIEILEEKMGAFVDMQLAKVMFVGNGAITYREKFVAAFGKQAHFASFSFNRELASSIALVAWNRAKNGDFDDYDTLVPMYLKKSQAERMLEGENA
ncbi:MAG: tRNA (adenosine(37)-N6)-threonylcarbamoyltransferase complex dimerization subunit type 1 TsaB [Clostridia bacterium]|nr:tRNA (adenosine(37)-N6)-threonylcarbamoyltransferase complex dimerization subunit type 1 TsaB [Clostridia bacterium]